MQDTTNHKADGMVKGMPAKGRKCPLTRKCLLCSREAPASITVKNPTWPAIMRVVLYTLAVNSPATRYFGLKQDIYPFIDSHWDVLCTGKSSNWHKPMQDALSHGLNLFVSGRNRHGSGYWGLKVYIDPWYSTEDGECVEDEKAEGQAKKKSKKSSDCQVNFPLSNNGAERKLKRKRGDGIPSDIRRAMLGEIKSLRKSMGEMESKLNGIKGDYELHKAEAVSIQKFNLDRENAEREVLELKNMYKTASGI